MKKQLLSFTVATGIFLLGFHGNASAHEMNYTVKSGDTLWKIANANGLSISELKAWNHLTSESILIGQSLTLVPLHSHDSSIYIVNAGDTLSGISKLTDLSVEELKKLNKLRSNVILPGQALKIGIRTNETLYAPVANLSTSATVNHVTAISSDDKVDALVTEAKKYIGTPYVWGGSTPAGFDCSGYINYVFAKVGVSLPRTVASIWGATKMVANPNVGDLVFFETYTSGPSHAGIYLGNNKFIHAGSSTGVTISDLTSTYWKSRYLGAKTAL